jgi:hypothetical protein
VEESDVISVFWLSLVTAVVAGAFAGACACWGWDRGRKFERRHAAEIIERMRHEHNSNPKWPCFSSATDHACFRYLGQAMRDRGGLRQ